LGRGGVGEGEGRGGDSQPFLPSYEVNQPERRRGKTSGDDTSEANLHQLYLTKAISNQNHLSRPKERQKASQVLYLFFLKHTHPPGEAGKKHSRGERVNNRRVNKLTDVRVVWEGRIPWENQQPSPHTRVPVLRSVSAK